MVRPPAVAASLLVTPAFAHDLPAPHAHPHGLEWAALALLALAIVPLVGAGFRRARMVLRRRREG